MFFQTGKRCPVDLRAIGHVRAAPQRPVCFKGDGDRVAVGEKGRVMHQRIVVIGLQTIVFEAYALAGRILSPAIPLPTGVEDGHILQQKRLAATKGCAVGINHPFDVVQPGQALIKSCSAKSGCDTILVVSVSRLCLFPQAHADLHPGDTGVVLVLGGQRVDETLVFSLIDGISVVGNAFSPIVAGDGGHAGGAHP